MAAAATRITQFVVAKPCISACHPSSKSTIACFGNETKAASWKKLRSSSFLPSAQTFCKTYHSNALKSDKCGVKAMATGGDKQTLPGLPIDLRGSSFTFSCSAFFVFFL